MVAKKGSGSARTPSAYLRPDYPLAGSRQRASLRFTRRDRDTASEPREQVEAVLPVRKDGESVAKERPFSVQTMGSISGLKLLIERLQDPKFLSKLDSGPQAKDPRNLRILPILDALGRKGTRRAEDGLLRLANNKEFRAESLRRVRLIEVCGGFRQPHPN